MNQETSGRPDFSSWKFPEAKKTNGADKSEKKKPRFFATEHDIYTSEAIKQLDKRTDALTNEDVADYFSGKSSKLSGGQVTEARMLGSESFLDEASESFLKKAIRIVSDDIKIYDLAIKDNMSFVPEKTREERVAVRTQLDAIRNFLDRKLGAKVMQREKRVVQSKKTGLLSSEEMAAATEQLKKTKVR